MFSFNVKVYYEDTDAQGVVYYANYLKYFERTRTQWMIDCGASLKRLGAEMDMSFVVRDVSIQYRKPAVLEDDLTITLQVLTLAKASMVLAQNVYLRAEFDKCAALNKAGLIGHEVISAKPLITSKVTLAAVKLSSLKPVKIPYDILPFSAD